MSTSQARTLLLAIGAILAAGVAARAAERTAEQLVRELTGVAPAPERSAEELAAAYAEALDSLAAGLASEDLAARQKAQMTLEDIALRSARPGADAERAACAGALVARLGADSPLVARLWVIRMLEEMGGDEAVAPLVRLLSDPQLEIRESVRRALARNPSAAVTLALREALAAAAEPAWRIGMIDALATRGDTESLPAFIELVGDDDLDVARAAVSAVGRIGDQRAVAATANRAQLDARPELRPYVDDARLKAAERLLVAGVNRPAAALLEQIYTEGSTPALRVAALGGLARVRGGRALPLLLTSIEDADPTIRATAARLMIDLPGPNVTRALAGKLSSLPPESQVLLLGTLAERGDAAALGAIDGGLRAESAAVREAALDALVTLGGAAVVPSLAQTAARGEGRLREAARAGLVRLGGADVDSAIVETLGRAGPPVRAELVAALGGRRVVAAVPALVEIAGGDTSPEVRLAALRAIGSLARPSHAGDLSKLLDKVQSAEEEAALEGAFAAAMRGVAEPDRRAAPLLRALPTTAGRGRLVLLRCLGATGSEGALEALRAAVTAPDVATQEAAVRGLAAWPDGRVAEELRQIASSAAAAPAVRQAAFAAYVRALGRPSDRDGAQTLELYRGALEMAPDPAAKKLVLEGLSSSPCAGTLALAAAVMGSTPELAADAAAAAVAIADAVAGTDPAEAEAALGLVLAAVSDEGLSRRAHDIIARMHKNADMLTAWQVAGPYLVEGQSGAQLFDAVFPPEDPAAAEVSWQLAPPAEADGWVNLQKTEMRGDNRAAYLRCQLYSPREQPVVLSVGSDDGIKVWVNGTVVHANNATRGHALDQDRAEATLAEGWNLVLVKVVNGGADWAASVRVRRPDGALLEGAKVKVE